MIASRVAKALADGGSSEVGIARAESGRECFEGGSFDGGEFLAVLVGVGVVEVGQGEVCEVGELH